MGGYWEDGGEVEVLFSPYFNIISLAMSVSLHESSFHGLGHFIFLPLPFQHFTVVSVWMLKCSIFVLIII